MSILFTNGDNETDGGALELDGADFITSADVGGVTYVFVAGGVDNGISVFALSASGALTNVANVTDSGALNLVGVSGLTTITSNGNTYLIAAGAGDNGLSVFRVGVNGSLTSVYDVNDGGSLNLGGVSRVASATVSGNAYVFAAGTNDDGVSVFKVQGNGVLTSVFDLADNATYKLDGVKGLTTAVVGGNTFLFTAGGVDDGVSVFVVAANGGLTHTSSVGDDATLKLDGASDVATAVVGGVTYLFVTGANDSGVSVFSVNASGILTNTANVGDTAALRLAGATGITVNTFGTTTYLTVGGTENGVSTFRVNAGGTLTAMQNIDDAGAYELAGTTQLATATVAGTNYIVAAGSTDDGVSTFGLHPTGQLWFATEGGDADTRIVRVNNDGSSQTINIDNSPATDPLPSSFQADVGVDTVSGFYFGLSNSGTFGDNAYLVRGVIGSSATPTIVIDFPDSVIVNGIQVDAINHKIYLGYQDGSGSAPANTGIRVYSYNASTGAITDQGFLVTSATDSRGQENGLDLLDPRDFALDSSIGRLFYTELLTGSAGSVGLFRLDLSDPTTTTQLVSQSQFLDTGANGYIYDVEVDRTTDLVYFSTQSSAPYDSTNPGSTAYNASQNAIWYISESASSGTAVKVTLVGAVGSTFYPGDMTFDQNTRQLYVESEEGGTGSADDVIYVFQLDGAGTTATLINTLYPAPTFAASGANIQGMTFVDLPVLSGLGATGSAATEQGAKIGALTGAPTITDFDGDHLASATVQITGGKFSSNESSSGDDHLGYGATGQISGLIASTNITVSWNATTETLTLSGYDTLANYQAVLGAIYYWSTGDNPTNYGLNTNRTLTWTVSDGTPDVAAGSVNSGTTLITVAAVNDAPVNGAVTSATGNEDANIAVTGLQVSDADANPAVGNITVTLSVTKGVLTLLTNVPLGLTAGEVSGNGSSTVTLTGSLNEINATLAATNGLIYAGNANVSGTDTLTVVTSDAGGSGSGGTLTDTDNYTITINGVNDAPIVSGSGTETLSATNEDAANPSLTNTISTIFNGQFSDPDANSLAGVAVVANGSSAGAGQWQYYNGSTWVNIGAASTGAALLLSASTAIRFLPAADYNGAAPTLTVLLVDNSGGALTSGTVVNTSPNGGTTPYSSGTVVLGHAVTAVNDAPTVTGGSTVSLTTIGEDSAAGAGQTVSSLFASHFSDAKDQVPGGSSANAFSGIAVTANAATAAQGVYQYFEGGAWHDLPAVSTGAAFVLDASTLVRFVPAADYSGTAPSLTVSMVEDSSGSVTTGATADLTTIGGSTAYSAAMTLNIVVTPTNDAPVPSGAATLTAVNEDTGSPAGATVSTLFGAHFSDPDGDSLAGVAISVNNASGAEGVWQYYNGASWVTIGAQSESSALIVAAGSSLRFLPAANYNGAAPTLSAYLIDNSSGAVTTGSLLDVTLNGGQTRFSDTAITLDTTITPVNDAPQLTLASTVGATEQTAALLLSTVMVSDIDLDGLNGGSGDYANASFVVRRNGGANTADTFAFDTTGASFTISGSSLRVGGLTFATFAVVSGQLTISFTSTGAVATSALVNDVIQHITYTNTSDAPPSSLTLSYQIVDGGSTGNQGGSVDLQASNGVPVNITAVNDVHTGGASISGTAAEDQTLTAVSTLSDPDGIGTLHYQWQHDVGGGYVTVGSDQNTYVLGDGDIGGVVRVVISYTDGGGTSESATSAATGAVTATNDAPTGGVTITGATTEDQVLTADTSTLADSDGLGTLHYQWQRDSGSGYVDVGADQATYGLGDDDVGAIIRVVVSYIDGQGFANAVTSADTTAILNVNDPHTGGASITGTATEDQVLTAVSTLADADGLGTLHYQWQRDSGSGYGVVGTDQATYTLGDADVGGVLRVVISYTDAHGTAESATSASTGAIVNVNDPPLGGISITGVTTEDQVLTAVTSSLTDADGLGTLHYQWTRGVGGGQVNVGADQATYTLGDADVGKLIGVKVSYVDGQGTAEEVSIVGTSLIAAVNDPHTGGVTISGTVTEDQVLTAVSTLADIDGLGTLHYQWQRDSGSGYVTVGADQATYTLGDADVGAAIRVTASYTDGQGFAESATSAATAAVANVNDPPVGGVSITGAATEDQTLTANTSTLADADGLGTLHYQWQRDSGSGYVSVGADQATYALGDPDVGGVLRVVVSYTDAHGATEAVTSAGTAAIAAVNDPHTGGVTISGTVTEDQVLTAVSTLADIDGLGTLHYQWQRDSGSGYVTVGADQATYTLGDADVGAAIRVTTSYTDGQGFAESATSAATAAVANVNDPPAGGVSVTGAATEDQTLTANTSTLADADGLGALHYQWQRDSGSGYVSVGADQATYALGDPDVGGVLRVVVSYTDAHGATEAVTSAGTAAIAAVNDPHTGGVTISGTVTEDQVLTAVSTLADIDGLGTLHYQWQRDSGSGFVTVGADQATYTLGDADVGAAIRVTTSYTDGQGFAESATSAATAAVANVNDPHTGGVSISGAATEDQVLTAVSTLADVDGLGALHYQWQRDAGAGFVNVGADQATYTLGDADVGASIRVTASYTDGYGAAEAATSAATAAVANINDAPTGGVTVTGTTTENQTLTANPALADADGLGTLHYQWQRDSGSGYVNVGADQATYTLAASDIGGVVRVVTSYTDGHGAAEAVASSATAVIIPQNGPHTGVVTITGTVTEDQVLTADTSTLADPGGLGVLHYQWQRDSGSGPVNVGADQATYTLGDADVGAHIQVVVSYTDPYGVFETETSPATSAVANVNDAPTGGVSISGAATEDQTLTAVSILADADGLGTLHYQWQRDTGAGFVNVGADQATYALGDADVNAAIRVVASYADGHGALESATSAASTAIVNVNDAPVGVNDATALIQRLSVSGSVRANDTDVDDANTALVISSVAFNFTHVDQAVTAGGAVVNGGFGVLTINPDGTYVYVANKEGLVAGQVVSDTFDYTVKDPSGATSTAQLTVTVTGSATGDANANMLISDNTGQTLTGRGGSDTLTGNGGADIFAYEAISDSTVAAFDTITDFTHAVDKLNIAPLVTSSTKLTLVTDGTNQFLYIDQNGDGLSDGLIVAQGQGLQVADVVTGVANFGFTIYGSANGDTLTGGAGNDIIAGFGGADVLRGGAGGDILYGGAGADTFVYGVGDSTLTHWDLVSDFTTGQDKLDISAADGGSVVISRLGGTSFIYFGGSGTGASVVQVLGDIQVDDLILSGAVTGVTIFGGFGVETLRGGAGADTLVGGTGTTTLIGGGGADVLYGGIGTDTFLYSAVSQSNASAYDLILNFDYGRDKVDISAIDGGRITLARFGGNTFIYSAPDGGGALQSTIAVQGVQLKTTDLVTSGGANQAFTLVGDGSNHGVADVLVGAGGNDILYGLDGADTLTGGGGADFLVGGAGADTFVFIAVTDSATIASDLIFDFSSAQGDKIDLSAIDANSSTATNDAFSVVLSFSKVAGQLIIQTPDSSGYYHILGDVNGDGVADFIIAVNTSNTLNGSDLIL
jgi:diphthamide synthase (EF-2-diphthine--ammonia ligase)/6-phosphogluconolactonase (cycloisomerase 2 family)